MVPALVLLANLSFREAVSVSLLCMCVTTPLGLWRHGEAGNVRWRTGLLLGLSGLAGVLAASSVESFFPEDVLVALFGLFLVFSAQRLAYGSGPLLRLSGGARILLAGFLAGIIAKLAGVGGGLIMVPALVFGGLDIHAAVATSLVAVFTNAAVGTGVNFLRMPGPWPAYAPPIILGALFGILAGTRLGLRTRSDGLRRAFAVLLVLVSLSLVHRTLA